MVAWFEALSQYFTEATEEKPQVLRIASLQAKLWMCDSLFIFVVAVMLKILVLLSVCCVEKMLDL